MKNVWRTFRLVIEREGLAHPRFRFPAVLVLMVISVFSLERLAIMIVMPERFEAFRVDTILQSFLTGLRFDTVVACMVAVPALAIILPAPRNLLLNNVFQWISGAYGGFVVALVFFACVADFFFFQEFGHRLDYKVFTYTHYDYIQQIIIDQYPLLLSIAATAVFFITGTVIIRRVGFSRVQTGGSFIRGITWSALIVGLVILGIRGSIGPKPINTGPAYFSSSPVLAQLTLNGCFTLREAFVTVFYRDVAPAEYYDVPGDDDALLSTKQMVAGQNDRFLDDSHNPLRRVTQTDKPRQNYNIVLVIFESLSWHYISALGGKDGLMPHFDELAEHGILMDHCFSVGERTTRGVGGVVSGFPDVLGESVTTRSTSVGNFLTLGSILARRGYQTMFVYGGQPYYDHRQSFLGSNGYNRLVFEKEFSSRTFRTHLGWCDGDLFRSAHTAFRAAKKPFFATLLTLSFHRPYEVPPGNFGPIPTSCSNKKQCRAIHYVDWALGWFIENASHADYFDNTIFVFVADSPGGFLSPEKQPEDFRIPLLIYAPEIIGTQGRRISTICSQTDVSPTILSLLGGNYEHCFFGSNVLKRQPKKGFAIVRADNNVLYFINGSGLTEMLIPWSQGGYLFQLEVPDSLEPTENEEQNHALQFKATGLLQAAYILNQRGVYN